MKNSRARLYDVLLVLILLMAAYFRFIGLDWDQSQHLHPDERFMTMVESAIEPVHSISEYFDTANSSLNPNNRGYGFYVYGTLPLFMVRYTAGWMSDFSALAANYTQLPGAAGQFFAWMSHTSNWAGYDESALVGRALAALSDLGTVFLLYLIAARLYGRKVGLLAAAFSSLAAMQIQQAHFFTVDSFANFFIFLAVYFAVEVMVGASSTRRLEIKIQMVEDEDTPPLESDESAPALSETEAAAPKTPQPSITAQIAAQILNLLINPLFFNTLGFGLTLGMAVASKINAAPLAVLLPGALIVRYFRTKDHRPQTVNEPSTGHHPLSIELALVLLVFGALMSVISFRVFQPYAFSGPGFLGFMPNPQWVKNIQDQQAQASGDVDFPPALQWARRSIAFSGYNLTAWGLGWPLGILAWLGFIYMAWRMLKGEWKEHALLWGWTLAYFAWQSTQWNPTMRYQLPVYPLLAMMAAWGVFQVGRFEGWKVGKLEGNTMQPSNRPTFKLIAGIIGLGVLLSTFAWAYAFTRIYTRDHSRVQATRWIFQNVPGPYNLQIGDYTQPMPFPAGYTISPSAPYDLQFTALAAGNLTGLTLGHAVDPTGMGSQTLTVTFRAEPDNAQVLSTASLTADFTPGTDPRGTFYTLTFDRPVAVEKGTNYFLRFETDGSVVFSGSAPVHETSWDDGLPLRMDGYDAYGGIYQGNLNFEMYWDDNPEKLERFIGNLDAGDYVFITSNRQWATTTRIPERYPLTVAFYRNLLGCPAEKDVIWCYNMADTGMFQGTLGYELVKTFTSYPDLFGYQINTQFAEEAFTVYDAPKVLLFKKSANYNGENVRSILSAVDLTHIVRLTPRKASSYRALDLMLPADIALIQQEGGTWSELFSYDALQNKYPLVGLLVWYLGIALLGLFTWPFLRLLLPGLGDGSYPLARLAGLLLLAFFAWMVGSLGGQYSRLVIAAGYGLIILAGALAAFVQRDQIRDTIQTKWRFFLTVEGLFLLLFMIDLLIRVGNPDLWHPYKGGERPMDFSYLNAVIKSTTFPPYDPWFGGGYINYYYWGFVLVGTPIKLFGIAPSIAYNLVLPTLFAMLGIGGFAVAWNLVSSAKSQVEGEPSNHSTFNLPLLAGFAASIGLVLIGNLGTIRMIFQGLQRMAVANEIVENPEIWFYQRWLWAFEGLGKLFTGSSLPYGTGDWYWNPSRVIPSGPGNEITEFPLFTFLYSDLHAHMLAQPLMVLAIAWALSTLLARNLNWKAWLGTLAFGGLVIGALRPTNTWDFPTYMALGALVAGYSIFRYADIGQDGILPGLPMLLQRIALALIGMGLLAGFSLLFFQPFAQWYGLGYNQVLPWDGPKTPFWSYITHWGLFLFILIAWMAWETRQWMAQTPVSALAKLKPYELLIEITLGLLVVVIAGLMVFAKANLALFILPLAFWALVLMLRPDQPDAKRFVLFLIGTGLFLTLVVEVIVLAGDIGRMNTIFKFYLQVWIMFAISSAAALGWILAEFEQWSFNWRTFFQAVGGTLFMCAALFTLTATGDKIHDRMAPGVPLTLDSMTYMNYATYSANGADMDLSQDYRAIRWMQANIKGSPIIVEANSFDLYRWTERITIYTGLPGVVGWDWHQRQQRAILPGEIVSSRVQDVIDFYESVYLASAQDFLETYNVKYIVVGQLERSSFPDGIAKFERYNGRAWQEVYRDGETVIYEVLP